MSELTTQDLGTERTSAALSRAVLALMRPLVRLLLEKQLTYVSLVPLLKRVFVDVAARDLEIEGRRQTDSRVSLLTGIHRKDVKRLRQELSENRSLPSRAGLGALVVSRWIGSPEYQDELGEPLRLERTSESGPSFEKLVASVNGDIPACSVLDEWLRLGVVERDEDGRIRLTETSFVPEQGLEEKLHFFGRNLHDHIAAGTHNILGEGPPFLDRTVYYDKLSAASAEELAAFARREGAALLQRVNQRAFELQRRDEEDPHATRRITMGTYFYSTDVDTVED